MPPRKLTRFRDATCRATYVNFSNLFVTFAYIPLSLLWVVPMARMGKIPKEDLNMNKKPFMVMVRRSSPVCSTASGRTLLY